LRHPKISVVLVEKNALPLIRGTLNSLRAQTFKDFEVVVVDGASTDGTVDVLHEAATDLPLRIVSEPDRSLADGFAKALRRATGDIVGMLCADERYYPNTLEQVVRWFSDEPEAVVCGGKEDFIDEREKVIDRYLTGRFNLPAHLACELVPCILASFFNRRLIGADLRFDPDVPTCPDYEFWARLGFKFPTSAFKYYDFSIAQAYRTRDSMSFRAESFTQMCRDKLTHLNNLLAKGYITGNVEAVRRRASAGIHMWAAEQLNSLEHDDYSDILAHCAEAARYDKSYERIARFVAATGIARYDAAAGIVTRAVPDRPGPRTVAMASLQYRAPSRYWPGAAIISENPLTVRTSTERWGYSLELPLPENNPITNREYSSGGLAPAPRRRRFSWVRALRRRLALPRHALRTAHRREGGQYWVRLTLEVVEGCAGFSMSSPSQSLIGELFIRPTDGRKLVLLPLPIDGDPVTSVTVRSGGHPSSVLRIYHAELLCDPDVQSGAAVPIEFVP
jgi:glycosyltransferase involved in cell wall biosynthesis